MTRGYVVTKYIYYNTTTWPVIILIALNCVSVEINFHPKINNFLMD